MDTKKIIFSDGSTRDMNFEEVKVQFTPLVKKTMREANNKFFFNKVEEEDFLQELYLELWRTFENYEYEYGNCFTTYLCYKLQKGIRNATYSKFSLKNQGIEVSMNAPLGDEETKLEDMFSTTDDSADNLLHDELMALILSNTDSQEKEMLSVLIDRKNYSIQQYANNYDITRQAANQRIVKLPNKLKKIISEQYFENNYLSD